MSSGHYTYTLAYPSSMGGVIFYVGQGQGDRINHHEQEARRGIQSIKCDIIRSIWEQGGEVVKKKVVEHLTQEQALAHEQELIRLYGLDNLANVPLRRTRHPHLEYIPPSLALLMPFREIICDMIGPAMEKEDKELSRFGCTEYLRSICERAILDHLTAKTGINRLLLPKKDVEL